MAVFIECAAAFVQEKYADGQRQHDDQNAADRDQIPPEVFLAEHLPAGLFLFLTCRIPSAHDPVPSSDRRNGRSLSCGRRMLPFVRLLVAADCGAAHLGCDAVAHAFHLGGEGITGDVLNEILRRCAAVTLGVHVLEAPDLVGAAVGVFQGRRDAVDRDSLHIRVVDQIGQSDIADGAVIVFDRLHQRSGVVGFQSFVAGFFSAADCPFLEQSAGSGRGRTGDQDDVLVRAADFFPVRDLGGEDIRQLLGGQVGDAQRLAGDRRHRDDGNLMVRQRLGDVSIEFFFRKHIGITDVNRAVCNLLQSGSRTAAVDRDGNIGIDGHVGIRSGLDQRQQSRRSGSRDRTADTRSGGCRSCGRISCGRRRR